MTGDLLAQAQEEFRRELIEAGLLIDLGVAGMYGRDHRFEQVIERVQAAVRAACDEHLPHDARRLSFPPLYPREYFEHTDYIASFPNLTGAISTFTGGDKEHRALLADREAGRPWDRHLSATDSMLVSAACHPLYGTLPPQLPDGGCTVDLTGWCFRHEPSLDPARMQAFRMHEVVRVGTADDAAEHIATWKPVVLGVLRSLGLDPQAVPANDPFFGRAGRLLSKGQREENLKTEMVVRLYGELGDGTAIASCNEHQTHFGDTFGLTAGGTPANSACVGFGLERIALAMLRTHGLDPGSWPDAIAGSSSR